VRERWAELVATGRAFTERVRARVERLPGAPSLVEVQRSYVQVRGTALAASITLYLFLALFAVTVLAVAVLGFLSAGGAHFARDLPGQLGLTGTAGRLVHDAVDSARRSRRAATLIGIVGLAWTGTSLALVIGVAYDAAWRVRRRGLVDRFRGVVWLAGAAVAIAAGALATAAWSLLPAVLGPLVLIVALATNTALFLWTSWYLPHRRVPLRALLPAAVLGGVCLEALKLVGAYVVPRLVASSSEIYGTIGVVFALLTWLLVIGRIIVYVALVEANGWERHHGERDVEVRVPALPHR
jgi:membrane protein